MKASKTNGDYMNFVILLLGMLIGSFLNVCIYRIPKKQSIAYPSSHCPKCDESLKPVDLLPVISYFLNRRRCRYCGDNISPQYVIVELLNGLIYILLYLKFGLSLIFLKYIILASLLIVISFIDYKLKIIPNELIVFGLIVGLAFNIFNFSDYFFTGIIGMLIGGGIFLLIALLAPMGGGDIKLMGILGLFLGGQLILLTTLLSFITGALISVILIVLKIKSRKDEIPFAPFISLAAIITLIYGEHIISWYLALI